MTAKEYLQQAFMLDNRIRARERQLESLKEHAVYSTPQFDSEAKRSVLYKSRLEENAVKIVELEKEIQQRVQEMVDLRREIQQTIKAINNDEYETILEMRYLSFMTWDEIVAMLGYSRRNAFKLHGKALSLIHVPQQAERKAS